MALFVLHRNYTHASKMGHTITFKKGDPTYVPPECRREVLQIGAIPVDSDGAVDLLDPEKVEVLPISAEDRQEQLLAAFALLEERNHRRDFTGQGLPSLTALAGIIDFEVAKKEVEDLWRAYREEKGAE
jgi:hypothetical protein